MNKYSVLIVLITIAVIAEAATIPAANDPNDPNGQVSVRSDLNALKISIKIHRSRKYRKIMLVEASTQINHPFAEEENKIILLFVNVKQEKYDSSSKQVKN
jgi:hypothetical protein